MTKEIEDNGIDEIVAANEAIVSNEAGEADANKANKVEANKAANEADAAKEDAEKVRKIIVHLCCCWRPFSLTICG